MRKLDPIPTRSELLRQVRDPTDTASWSEFCRTYGGLIKRLALKAELTEDEADEVVQDVFVGVGRNIGTFEYDRSKCSFKHWLSQLVRWRIQDQLRRRLATHAGRRVNMDTVAGEGMSDGRGEVLAMEADLEGIWEEEWRRNEIARAVDRTKGLVGAKQFQMFYLHVLKELPVAEVRRQLNVTAAQIYLAKLRVGRVFRRALEAQGGNG